MTFEVFMNFNGNCREALDFYAKVFKSKVSDVMTYADAPADPNHKLAEEDRNKIMYAHVKIGDKNIMFMDMPMGYPATIGNNITPGINIADKDEINRLFNELKEGGTVEMEPQKTFFSEWYANVTDKFGIVWHIVYP
jgi:PhnB protein